MEVQQGKKKRFIQWLKLSLKILVSLVCLWYVSGKIDFKQAAAALRSAEWLYILPALLFFCLSKVFSAWRLNIYFTNINIHLSTWQNIRVYWLGMFYNLFLPGSISGDAYKVIRLTKQYAVPYKKTTSAVLLDRLSGLVGLGLILAIYSLFVLEEAWMTFILVAGAVLATAALYLICRIWLKDFLSSFGITLFWGIVVQLMQVICIYLVMSALNIPISNSEYIWIFLVSSVVAVLPLTIGGLGLREIVFLEASKYFGLLEEHSVMISIIFYLITLLTSAAGIIYVFRDPLQEIKEGTEVSGD
jgi:uncharacterized membrane protein YbhN (UPF0104 family)